MPPEPTLELHTLDRQHKQFKESIATGLEALGFRTTDFVVVGSASQESIFFGRKPNDLDFYVKNPLVWEKLKKIGKEVPGTIGNTVIQLKINGKDAEFFQYLPGLNVTPEEVFAEARMINGVLFMGRNHFVDWKRDLARRDDRPLHKKANDLKDIERVEPSNYFEKLKSRMRTAFAPDGLYSTPMLLKSSGPLN